MITYGGKQTADGMKRRPRSTIDRGPQDGLGRWSAGRSFCGFAPKKCLNPSSFTMEHILSLKIGWKGKQEREREKETCINRNMAQKGFGNGNSGENGQRNRIDVFVKR
jgi:hypothetical protein